jgi:cysteine desulfurase
VPTATVDRVYLDHAATTPLRPEVMEAMVRTLAETPGNPSSPHHEGRNARRVLEDARERVAAALGVDASHVTFTRGGTESDNLAVLGRARGEPRGAVVISALEHSAVREPARRLEAEGRPVIVLPFLPTGAPDLEALVTALQASPPPALLSVQAVNSETGLVLEVGTVLERAAPLAIPVHVDAVQALGRIPLPAMPALLTLSAHKVGGPRGIGILIRDPAVTLMPLQHGGSQEGGLRPGTEDVAGAVGCARAVEMAVAEQATEAPRLEALRAELESTLVEAIPELRVHGREGPRAPHILSVGLAGVPRDVLPGALDLEGVAVSAGSACRSGSTEPSPVLAALYGDEDARVATVRFSLGRTTTRSEVEAALPRILRVLHRVRTAFPVPSGPPTRA